jgi:hypothetical protein
VRSRVSRAASSSYIHVFIKISEKFPKITWIGSWWLVYSEKWFVSLQFLILRHSVGLLGRVISPSQGRYLIQTHNKHKQTSMHRVGFEPTIPGLERAKTVHGLDRAATVIGTLGYTSWKFDGQMCQISSPATLPTSNSFLDPLFYVISLVGYSEITLPLYVQHIMQLGLANIHLAAFYCFYLWVMFSITTNYLYPCIILAWSI